MIWLIAESKKKMIQMNLSTKQKRLTDLENKLMVTGWGGIVREFGIDMYTLLYLK